MLFVNEAICYRDIYHSSNSKKHVDGKK